MKILKQFFLIAALSSACFGVDPVPTPVSKPMKPEFPKIENIFAGALFEHNGTVLILIETWDHKFFYGNSWGKRYCLHSDFAPGGGTVEAVCADLRKSNYLYIGKAE